MHLLRILISASLSTVLLGLIGCAPTAIVGPAASTVRFTHNEPGAECPFLGDVTGSQGDFLRGSIIGNANLEPVMI